MKRRGFSLIELLVTVLITSIIVIAAYQLLTSTANSFGDEDNRRLLEANLRNAELLIQRDISRTGYAYGYTADTNEVTTAGRSKGGSCVATRLDWEKYPKKVAFKHASDGKNSAIQIIASISDYDDFTVSSFTGGTVKLDRTVTLPLVASQVYQASVNGTDNDLRNDSADEATFLAIFSRMFRGASAIEISTPDTGTAVALIKNVKSDGTFSFVSNTSLFPQHCSIDPERPLVENTVNPIITIIYRLNNGQLERCVTNVNSADFAIGKNTSTDSGSLDKEYCDVLLDNVEYFHVYPILKSSEFDTMDLPTDKTVAEAWNTVTISQLYGAMFRIGAAVPSSLKQLPDGDKYLKKDDKVYLYSHAQGAALFQEPREGNATLPGGEAEGTLVLNVDELVSQGSVTW